MVRVWAEHIGWKFKWMIQCTECDDGLEYYIIGNTRAQAIREWNNIRRHTTAEFRAVEAECKALKARVGTLESAIREPSKRHQSKFLASPCYTKVSQLYVC